MSGEAAIVDLKAEVAGSRPSTKARHSRKWSQIITTVALVLFSVAWIAPVIGMLVTSFRPTAETGSSGWWTVLFNPFYANWTTQNYLDALSGETSGTGMSLASQFLNSVAVSVPATILPITVGAFAAYGFTFLKFRGRELLFSIFVGLMVVPQQVAIVPILQGFRFFTQLTGIQVTGTFAAAWIVHAAYALPLCTYLLRNFMSTLPESLIEAAHVDGASHFMIFLRLVVPLSTPALAAFAIFQFLWIWNDYLIAYIFIGNANPVLQQGLLALLGEFRQGWNLVAAGSFLVLIIPLIVFLALQRYFVRGLTSGAVK